MVKLADAKKIAASGMYGFIKSSFDSHTSAPLRSRRGHEGPRYDAGEVPNRCRRTNFSNLLTRSRLGPNPPNIVCFSTNAGLNPIPVSSNSYHVEITRLLVLSGNPATPSQPRSPSSPP